MKTTWLFFECLANYSPALLVTLGFVTISAHKMGMLPGWPSQITTPVAAKNITAAKAIMGRVGEGVRGDIARAEALKLIVGGVGESSVAIIGDQSDRAGLVDGVGQWIAIHVGGVCRYGNRVWYLARNHVNGDRTDVQIARRSVGEDQVLQIKGDISRALWGRRLRKLK